MKTITGREINVTPNHSKRTFTIRTNGYGPNHDNSKIKYRTIKMDQEEFDSNLNNTANDWQQFLDNTNDYYKI